MSYLTGTLRNKYPYHLYLLCVFNEMFSNRIYNSFFSSKTVALTRGSWCVVCVVDYPASSVK